MRCSASLSAGSTYRTCFSKSLRWAGSLRDYLAETNKWQLFGHQRSANADVPRDRRSVMGPIAEEDAQLQARVVVARVTVLRLLFESPVNARIASDTVRKDMFAVRCLMVNHANNVNQRARSCRPPASLLWISDWEV